ncbi:carbohydrate ABC transporter membrane protein 2 (CUT1 family) [Hydrogenispora ethanolica]|jgi:ABC-type glycerol-3-phosphate transport system permease component|uniref:Carbohydrate ABC transporter membrane protein 2 (CUT1 family) n=1 Tax=Hydrogenispora ethanolica TaxID=1082276 RepID=A0A4R1REC7_HYDET|nr:carbohydrate ABC transporter permease [Hydrogenispora ethanolica]TCL64251.1 carbohydrate ABC transporter membrane protein 2 (CUT1 family) [Hydrogenispora ethanolica]
MKTKRINILPYLLMGLVALIFLFPMAWTIISALKPEGQIVSYPPQWIPQTPTLENFTLVLQKFPFMQWVWNSVFLAIVSTVLVLVLDSMAAYAFGRLEFRGKKILFGLIVSMLLVPIQAYVVPLYMLFSTLGMLNSYTALILPVCANVTGVFLLTCFFRSIPNELQEAAMIDGCNDFTIFYRVMIPLSKPALSSVAIITFISSWNSFLWPLIAIRSDHLKPLPVGVAQFMGAAGGVSGSAPQYGISLSAACMAVLPTLIVFLILQRFFVQGIVSSGIKG